MNKDQYKSNMIKYVLESIYCTGYTEEKGEFELHNLTDRQKVHYIGRRIKKECLHEYNLRKFNNNYKVIIGDFLRGLPSYINIEFENYKILELIKNWGGSFDTAAAEEIYLHYYWDEVAAAILYLFNKYGVKYE